MRPDLQPEVFPAAPADSDDEAQAAASRGENLNADDDVGDIDEIGRAAGIVVRDEQPLRIAEIIDERDRHRWEDNPASTDDGGARR